MRIKMIKTRNFVDPAVPGRGRTVQFIAGRTYPEVKRDWAEEMIGRGEAIATTPGTRQANRRPLAERVRPKK
jgi:hypothetical protein